MSGAPTLVDFHTGSKALETLEDDDVHQLVGKVRTVRQLLEAGPSPVLAPRADLLRGRCLELMVTKAIADCDAFVAFCASRLTPAQGLKVVRDAVQSLGYNGDSLRETCADCDGAVRLAAVAPEDNDGDVYVVGADAVARKLGEAAAAVAGGGVPEFPLAFAETDVEAFLKDVLRREDGALREAIRRELRAAEGLPERPTPRKGARVLAPWTDGTLYAANCVEIKILRRVRTESSRRSPRHRCDACSMAWRCRFLTARRSQRGCIIAETRLNEELSGAPDALVDFHTDGPSRHLTRLPSRYPVGEVVWRLPKGAGGGETGGIARIVWHPPAIFVVIVACYRKFTRTTRRPSKVMSQQGR